MSTPDIVSGPQWKFPAETKLLTGDDYVPLETVDLSQFDWRTDEDVSAEDVKSRNTVIQAAMRGFGDLGAVYVVGHGLDEHAIQHQFNLGSVFFDGVNDDEKSRYVARIREDGDWAGYKSFNFYPETLIQSRVPLAARPFIGDYRRFLEINHYVVVGKILAILSLGMKVPIDTLWNLHHRGGRDDGTALKGSLDGPIEWSHSEDHFRFQLYSPPSEEAMKKKPERLWQRSHTDIGTITLNYSQPISALQFLRRDGSWGWVRHKPGAIVVNFGNAMEFLTAGKLKAAYHRVAEPPEDQRHHRRLCIHYFVKPLPDVRIDTPVLISDEEGSDQFKEYRSLGGKPMSYAEWEVFRSKWAGSLSRPSSGARKPEDVLLDIHFREGPY